MWEQRIQDFVIQITILQTYFFNERFQKQIINKGGVVSIQVQQIKTRFIFISCKIQFLQTRKKFLSEPQPHTVVVILILIIYKTYFIALDIRLPIALYHRSIVFVIRKRIILIAMALTSHRHPLTVIPSVAIQLLWVISKAFIIHIIVWYSPVI